MPGSWPAADFPNLNIRNHQITSPATRIYNCLAWAAGKDNRRWDPAIPYYWPKGIPRERTLDALAMVYESEGFSVCIGGLLEPGIEKVALFAIDTGGRKVPTHAARQLESGEWTSKLGDCEDISHATYGAVSGPAYGDVVVFLSRQRPAATHQPI